MVSRAALKDAISKLETQVAGSKPLIIFHAPVDDAETTEVFAKAHAGDATAQAQLRQLIRDRDWVNWLGDLGQQATHQLIHKAAGADVVWKAGIAQKANALREELLGEKASVLATLLVRRVANDTSPRSRRWHWFESWRCRRCKSASPRSKCTSSPLPGEARVLLEETWPGPLVPQKGPEIKPMPKPVPPKGLQEK